MGKRIYLNNDWRFASKFNEELLDGTLDPNEMEIVRLPHSCVETPYNYFDESIYQMVSGYLKDIEAPKEWEGKKIILTIDGAAHESEVFLNGEKIGDHHCGYTAFSIDLSDKLIIGSKNSLVVKVDSREDRNIPPFGFVIDYMTYGGIYRDVYLDIYKSNYIEDIFVHSNVDISNVPEINIRSKISLNTYLEGASLVQFIKKKGDDKYLPLGEGSVTAKDNFIDFKANDIELWDIDKPVLYNIKSQLKLGDKILDEKVITTGFRKAEFKKDGFYLNNRKVRIRGLNRHQSYPYVGYAMPESMQKLDADILKYELGLNAVRTSHYPQSHHFIDRCDEIGLLVFTEIPGWQYIGDEAWKDQAISNTRDMIVQYRNHCSIILWGVRINESPDDDDLYLKTNQLAHKLDKTRPTGGVRNIKKSSFLEDVYTYNDFSHDGKTKGCEEKKKITSDMDKPYLVCEYNGHMFPTKAFDSEKHRQEHAIRHANVLNAINEQEDIAGSFGWCMFDYNTHMDFGSGDRICYHGVMDMFRNPKLAAHIYASQSDERDILSITSSMDIGEHPASNRGHVYIITNADSVRMYRNDQFIKEYRKEDSTFKYLEHGPILIDDYIGDLILDNEDFKSTQAREIKETLNAAALYGVDNLPTKIKLKLAKLMGVNGLDYSKAVELYTKYIGDWGASSRSYRFEAIKDGKVVKTVTKAPMQKVSLSVSLDHSDLVEKNTYDVALVRIKAIDENKNMLPYYNEPLLLETEGPLEIIGPKIISLKGGMGGTLIKTIGKSGDGRLKISGYSIEDILLDFSVKVD